MLTPSRLAGVLSLWRWRVGDVPVAAVWAAASPFWAKLDGLGCGTEFGTNCRPKEQVMAVGWEPVESNICGSCKSVKLENSLACVVSCLGEVVAVKRQGVVGVSLELVNGGNDLVKTLVG